MIDVKRLKLVLGENPGKGVQLVLPGDWGGAEGFYRLWGDAAGKLDLPHSVLGGDGCGSSDWDEEGVEDRGDGREGAGG